MGIEEAGEKWAGKERVGIFFRRTLTAKYILANIVLYINQKHSIDWAWLKVSDSLKSGNFSAVF